ncbi:uncharacterized protein [Nerophis lumbriciformis]|uniref:uncharacterized protein n=1 Tax=Nerophis lumbriciformis TaxID=546530 RepID=UPI002ADF5FDD|nr:uncharacterized protein LOC133622956 [Nerophis lumbriciformis]
MRVWFSQGCRRLWTQLAGLVAVASLTAASDPTCEELVVSLEDRNLVSGKWIFYAGTSDNQDFLNELEKGINLWVHFSLSHPDSDNIPVRWGHKEVGKCTYENLTSTYSRGVATVETQYSLNAEEHSEKYLKSCPDCLLLVDHMTVKLPNLRSPMKGRLLLLLTRTGTLDDAQLEVFKKQAACLNFTKKLHFADNTELCPE